MAHSHHHHDAGDNHQHGHGHNHAAPASINRAFAIGVIINLAYTIIEVVAGVFAHSIALLADAAHNASDVVGLLAAYVAGRLALSAASARFTYGKRRASILSVLGNAVALLIVTGGIAWEAVLRIVHTPHVAGGTVMLVAAVGIVVNGGSALLFLRGQGELNVRGAFLHLAGDAALAAATVVAGGLIFITHVNAIDPLISLAVSGYMIWATWSLLRRAVGFAMDAVPPGLDTGKIADCLGALPGVISMHDLHVWPVSTTETALTAHLIRADATGDAGLLAAAGHELAERFGIRHATLQLEAEGAACVCVFL